MSAFPRSHALSYTSAALPSPIMPSPDSCMCGPMAAPPFLRGRPGQGRSTRRTPRRRGAAAFATPRARWVACIDQRSLRASSPTDLNLTLSITSMHIVLALPIIAVHRQRLHLPQGRVLLHGYLKRGGRPLHAALFGRSAYTTPLQATWMAREEEGTGSVVVCVDDQVESQRGKERHQGDGAVRPLDRDVRRWRQSARMDGPGSRACVIP